MKPDDLFNLISDRTWHWQNVMGLMHWRLELLVVERHELPDEDALACCSPQDSYDSAKIRFADDLLERADSDQTLDYIIVHELLHIAMRDLDEAFFAVSAGLGTVAGQGYRSRWDHEVEGFVDRMAHVILNQEKGGNLPSCLNESEIGTTTVSEGAINVL